MVGPTHERPVLVDATLTIYQSDASEVFASFHLYHFHGCVAALSVLDILCHFRWNFAAGVQFHPALGSVAALPSTLFAGLIHAGLHDLLLERRLLCRHPCPCSHSLSSKSPQPFCKHLLNGTVRWLSQHYGTTPLLESGSTFFYSFT